MPEGTPQGGPLSPLLANIYLDPLDKELERRGSLSCAMPMTSRSTLQASGRPSASCKASSRGWRRSWGWKSTARRAERGQPAGRSLLGFRLYEDGRVGVSPKAVSNASRSEVRDVLECAPGTSEPGIARAMAELHPRLVELLPVGRMAAGMEDLSGWVRRHMRKCFWQRWHHPRGRLRALRRLGIEGRSLGMAYPSAGAWAVAHNPVLQRALRNATLNRYGLILPWVFAPAQG